MISLQTSAENSKADIETQKADIENQKPDIEILCSLKTKTHISRLRRAFSAHEIFGRTDVMNVLDIQHSRASELLRDLLKCGIIGPVFGYGKGKYRFCK